MNQINNWRLKSAIPQTECFDLNSLMTFNQDIGKVMTLKDGKQIMQNLSNYFVTWGIFLSENKLIETNFEPKKEEALIQSYVG